MLAQIEAGGMDAVLSYARDLDGWVGSDLELTRAQLEQTTAQLSADLREALELGLERTRRFASEQRARLVDFEVELVPGLVTGQRYVPVQRAGAYLPAGRFPLLAGGLMTVGVAKLAGVSKVLASTPPRRDGTPDPAVAYVASISQVDRIFVVGACKHWRRWHSACWARSRSTSWWARAMPTWQRQNGSCSAPWRSTCWPVGCQKSAYPVSCGDGQSQLYGIMTIRALAPALPHLRPALQLAGTARSFNGIQGCRAARAAT
jgi:Histidinol dehydrogenase